MPLHDLPFFLLTRHLGDVALGEALLFPEILALHAKPARLASSIRALAKEILSESSPLDVHRRALPAVPSLLRVPLTLDPPTPSAAWSEPITLQLDVLRWHHGHQPIAYIPSLGIEVLADRDDALDSLILQHARAALARTGVATRLFDLAQLARVESVTIDSETLTADIPTPAQIAADRSKEEAAKPVIEEAGTVLDDARATPAYEVDALVDRLADALVGRVPRSLLLVGPSGVGKTALFVELFRQRRRHRLASAPFWMTSGARLIAGATGYGVWQERCQKLTRQARQAGAVLHLGNLVELMEVGKGGGSNFGIASFFRPYLARGDFLAVAECTPEQLPLIERAHPHLLAVFQTLKIDEPTAETNRQILRRAATASTPEGKPSESPITDDALGTLDFLHRRYATYSASPGRPLRFLRNLLQDRPPHTPPVSASEVTQAFSRETGLPRFLLDDAAPLDLPAARAHFETRVIGQPQAVDRVLDLLATVKAALNRPRRPVASLLFIGPTGVGKTEMAKALADYFFGDAAGRGARMVRFDMSEYATPAAVTRLVGAAWETQGLLTSKVREEPFCVLLFDEFEKAHPAFFDLLLQVLGEGRLTDSAGRLADFSNAIVVMTSNLGAESYGAGPFGLARATTSPADHAADHFTQAVQGFLRPELFNRIDRVIPFHPLGPETVRKIAAREIDQLARRDGIRQRDLQLDVAPAAVAHLAAAGYDALYGARPLKRRIDRDLLAPLADAVNQYAPAIPLVARVDVADDHLQVAVRARPSKADASTESSTPLAARAASAASLRRQVQRLARCPAALSLHNELFTLDRLLKRKEAHPGNRFIDPVQRERRKRLQILADAITDLDHSAVTLEDALLLRLYETAPLPFQPGETLHRLAQLDAATRTLLLGLLALNQASPHLLTLALFASHPPSLFTLARAYRQAALDIPPAHAPGDPAPVKPAVAIAYFTRLGKSSLGRTSVHPDHADTFLADPRPGVLGIALTLQAPFARSRFEGEAGLHVVEPEKNQSPIPLLVDTSSQASANSRPPKDVEFRIALAGQRRRTYNLDRGEAFDPLATETYHFPPRALHTAIHTAIHTATEAQLKRQLDALLQD
jgi:ATP-dependent Clp protease ATP-binding subunit ClpA